MTNRFFGYRRARRAIALKSSAYGVAPRVPRWQSQRSAELPVPECARRDTRDRARQRVGRRTVPDSTALWLLELGGLPRLTSVTRSEPSGEALCPPPHTANAATAAANCEQYEDSCSDEPAGAAGSVAQPWWERPRVRPGELGVALQHSWCERLRSVSPGSKPSSSTNRRRTS